MQIGVLKEIKTKEHRVAVTPEGVEQMRDHGHKVRFETGAGDGSDFSDKEYQNAGLGSIFYLESFKTGIRKGINGGELSWILEDNTPMNKAAEFMGAEKSKTYRVYEMKF